MKSFFVALIGGIIGIVAGFFAGAFAGSSIAAATHMSNFEGAAGYFAVLIGLLGAVIGLFLGVWIAFRMLGVRKNVGTVIAYGVLSLGSVIAGGAVVIWLMLFFNSTLNRGSAKPQALFEIRMPPGTKLAADRSDVEIELNTDQNSAYAYKSKEEYQYNDGNRPVISGGVDLAFRTSSRIVVVKRKGEPDLLFKLNLSGKPGHSDAFGPWQPIDWIADGGSQPRKATPYDQYEIRYRVRDPNVEFSRPILKFELNLPATTRLFEIKLPPLTWITETIRYATTSPADDSSRAFGPWLNAGFIHEPGQKDARAAKPEDDAKFRYRLE